MSSVHDWICLSLLPGLGLTGFWKLVNQFGSPAEVLQRTPVQLGQEAGLRKSQLAAFESLPECRVRAEDQLQRVQAAGGRIVSHGDAAYPELLRRIPDPPAVLYCLGNFDLLHKNCLAVVGSRSSTNYGRRVAQTFSRQLSEQGVVVVSGMALGIDSEAHFGALEGVAGTVAVLGCGLDVIYPKQNRELYERICRTGLLISEYPLGTKPEAFRFPARNRIIAGVSRGVMVVEAARKSGSLITAQMGLDFGREVFAVPGQVDSLKSEGTHWLIQQGAQLVLSAGDIMEGLQFASSPYHGENSAGGEEGRPVLEPDMVTLLNCLGPYPQTVDEVVEQSGLSVARASELFLILELDGYIEMLPGDQVRKLTE